MSILTGKIVWAPVVSQGIKKMLIKLLHVLDLQEYFMTEIRLICRLNYPMETIVRIVEYLWLLNEAKEDIRVEWSAIQEENDA